MNTTTILLTGATGFLGSHLLESFVSNQYQVVILKRSSSELWRIEHLLGLVKIYNVDEEPLKRAFTDQHIDCVVHTACYYGRQNQGLAEFVESNVLFGLRVLDAAVLHRAEAFINTDTFFVKEVNAYSLAKKQFVDWLERASKETKVVNLKLQHVYGTKDDHTKFIPWILNQLEQDVAEINLTKGDQKRDFIHVRDVVSAYEVILNKVAELKEFSEFDVGTGELISVQFFVSKLWEFFYAIKGGKKASKLNFGALPLRAGEMKSVEVNNQALKNLGWFPQMSLGAGIRDIIEQETFVKR